MKLDPPGPEPSFPALEREMLDLWDKLRAFERSVEERPEASRYRFYDGPPFATGLPHHGHLLASTIKDVVPRYQTMRGHRVDRRFGWDCHGLPVEFEMEKELGLKGRQDILNFGVDRFNEACRSIVLRYSKQWRQTIRRLGRWVDFDNEYKTMDPQFMESVWAVFSRLWERGLVYEDKKIVPYSPRITAPLSNFEAGLNYKDVQDPSVTLSVPATDGSGLRFLVWTTTPWTLPANQALAIHPNFTYSIVEADSLNFVCLSSAVARLFKDRTHRVIGDRPGTTFVGASYEPFFPWTPVSGAKTFTVLAADFVTAETGTGIVHIAPAFGEDDFALGRANGLSAVDHLDEEGRGLKWASAVKELLFKDSDGVVLQVLREQGKVFHSGTLQHRYPYCWRTDTPLVYRAIQTWFVRVTAIKEQLLSNNQKTHWVPEHLRDGRFGNWLENAKDWAISRNRFWGNPIPIWRSADGSETVCVGSRAELEALLGGPADDLHPHLIDSRPARSPKTGQPLTRIPQVFDCWFESGAVPFAQVHWPFTVSDAQLKEHFPARFIAEGLDQTRGWFYTLMVLSTALGKGAPFENVVVNGIVLAEDGRKMSKSLRNYPDPQAVFDQFGADALRVYLLSSGAVQGEDLRFSEAGLKEVVRKVLIPLWNAYSFLATYGSLDGWDPTRDRAQGESANDLDRWILIKLSRLQGLVEKEMDQYHLSRTVPPLPEFIDHLTNWYIRRSRRRFWKSSQDDDKRHAYTTLHDCLLGFVRLAAPFMPFLTEYIYQRLRKAGDQALPESLHLEILRPAPRLSEAELELEAAMDEARALVGLGREMRERHRLKVRQPLARLVVGYTDDRHLDVLRRGEAVVREELNIKAVEFAPLEKLANLELKPNFSRLGVKLGARIPELQKGLKSVPPAKALALLRGVDLQVGDLTLTSEDVLVQLKPVTSPEGLLVGVDGPRALALDAHLTPELVAEGWVRECAHAVQTLRKESGFEVADRITLWIRGPEAASAALAQWAALVEEETLASLVLSTEPPESAHSSKVALSEDVEVQISILRRS